MYYVEYGNPDEPLKTVFFGNFNYVLAFLHEIDAETPSDRVMKGVKIYKMQLLDNYEGLPNKTLEKTE